MDSLPRELIEYLCTKLTICDICVFSIVATSFRHCKMYLKDKYLIDCKLSTVCNSDRVLETISYLIKTDIDCWVNLKREIKPPFDQNVTIANSDDSDITIGGITNLFLTHKKYKRCTVLLFRGNLIYRYDIQSIKYFPQFVLACNTILNVPNNFNNTTASIQFRFKTSSNYMEKFIENFGPIDKKKVYTYNSITYRIFIIYDKEIPYIHIGGSNVGDLADMVELYEHISFIQNSQ
jgi:hypothetical protein